MAVPTILIDSATGSDSAASGAGPSTALTGTAASTNGGGTVVTLDAGTVLTGVATDGSHVIYLIDSTTGHRRFSKIVGSAGSGGGTPTVTVNEAFTGSLSGLSWAIGGKRASVFSATSTLLWNNNAAAGDAMPGWTVEMQNGHAENMTGTQFFCNGDSTDGFITLRGVAGATTRPKLTITSDFDTMFVPRNSGFLLQSFDVKNGDTFSLDQVCDMNNTAGIWIMRDIRVDPTGNKFFRFFNNGNNSGMTIEHCDISHMNNIAILSQFRFLVVRACYIHDVDSHAIQPDNDCLATIEDNVFSGIGGDAIHLTSPIGRPHSIKRNTFYNVTGDGIEFTGSDGSAQFYGTAVENNIFDTIGAYAINLSGVSAAVGANWLLMRNNNFHACTSGKYNFDLLAAGISIGEQTLDPQFTNTATGDFSVGTNMKAVGYPSVIGLGV